MSYDELERASDLDRPTSGSMKRSCSLPMYLEEDKVKELYKDFCNTVSSRKPSRDLDSSVMRYAVGKLAKSLHK